MRGIPEVMKAVVLEQFGGPEKLVLRTIATPSPGPNQVLIAVHTAGVGSWDADMREGWWPEGPAPLPQVLGPDGSGTVAKLGSRVRRFRVGQPVHAYQFPNPMGGFYAQYVVVTANNVAPKPHGLDLRHAGATPATGLTAHQGIDAVLRVRRGETVLVHGASGGVGSLAVQFAVARGAQVIGTATSPRGLALLRKLGATPVNGRGSNLTAMIRRRAPDGVDALLALAGGPSFHHCLDAVRPGGRVAYPNGVEPVPRKRRGVTMRGYDGTPGTHEFARLERAIEAAQLEVPIDRTFPLAAAAQAHRRLAARHVIGRIVLAVR
jgi:NADPH:quinone reductase-like Zn-dependent oxidoreductase